MNMDGVGGEIGDRKFLCHLYSTRFVCSPGRYHQIFAYADRKKASPSPDLRVVQVKFIPAPQQHIGRGGARG